MAAATTSSQTAALPCHCAPALGEGAGGRASEGDGGHAARWQSRWLVCRLLLPTMLFHHVPFSFPLNAFYLNFKASPALFFLHFFIPSLLCMVMPLEQNRPWNPKKRSWKRKLPAFFPRSLSFFPLLLPARFLHFTSRSPTAERPLLLLSRPRRFSALDGRKKRISLVRKSRASPFLPVFAVATSETYLLIHPPLCDIANTARHERFVFVLCRVCVFF